MPLIVCCNFALTIPTAMYMNMSPFLLKVIFH